MRFPRSLVLLGTVSDAGRGSLADPVSHLVLTAVRYSQRRHGTQARDIRAHTHATNNFVCRGKERSERNLTCFAAGRSHVYISDKSSSGLYPSRAQQDRDNVFVAPTDDELFSGKFGRFRLAFVFWVWEPTGMVRRTVRYPLSLLDLISKPQ